MSLSFYQQFLKLLKQEEVVLATVINRQGSVPREIGAKMVICANGDIFHTIGGGAGEAKVCQIAQTILKTAEKQRVMIDLSGASHKPTEGVCGGIMEVWVEKWGGETAINLIENILTAWQLGQTVSLFTPFSAFESPYLLSETDSIPSPARGFVEVLNPPPVLLIIGAGHVGIQLAKIGSMIGFQVMIQDDRPEWANPTHYPQATQIFTHPIAEVLSQWRNQAQLYIAMVTRGYTYDLEAFKAILEQNIPYTYLGMIGSKKRVRKVQKALEELHFPLDQLKSIYAPIGLDIGALTPEEIAVSIGAELILVQRGGTGRPLSDERI